MAKLPTIYGGDEFDPWANHALTEAAQHLGHIVGDEIRLQPLRLAGGPFMGHLAVTRGMPITVEYSPN